jgi:hypothetical protein
VIRDCKLPNGKRKRKKKMMFWFVCMWFSMLCSMCIVVFVDRFCVCEICRVLRVDSIEAQAILDEYSGPRYEIESRRITVVDLVIFVILENNL